MTINTAPQTVAYLQGFKVGLMSREETRYGYSNPYDRRKQTGKDWARGQKDGTTYRCEHGYQSSRRA